jgi:hypothetical protein
MTPLKHMRLGWIVTLGSIAAGVFIQATTSAFWIYRHWYGKGEVSTQTIILWPNLVPLLIAIAMGIFLVFWGYYRVVQARGTFNEAS